MSLEKGLDGNKFLNRIEEIFDKAEKRAIKKADEVGTNVGKAFSDSMANGLDAGKLMVEWQKFVRSINNNKTQIKPAKIQTILETAETLKDTERFGKTIRDQLSGIKATFGDVEVSGLDNVIEKFKTSANELSSIDWGFGKLHDNRKLMQEQVDLGEKLVKSAEQQAKASENAAKIAVDGAEKQAKAQTEVAKAIALTEKQMESAIKRYNKWMSRAGYDHRTIGLGEDDGYTKGWNLRDMVSEACETIENMRDIGEGNGTLSQMRAELNGLQGFINAYEKYIGDMQTTMNHSTLGNKYDNTPKLKEQQKIIEDTTKFLERQGKVYKTISVQKDNTFAKNEQIKRLAVEATTAAIERQRKVYDSLDITNFSFDRHIAVELQKNPNVVADLTAQKDELMQRLQPVKAIVSEISSLANVKNIPFDKITQEAAETAKQLATMYDDGITDTKEYIALQYKLVNLIDRYADSAGRVSGSGAKNMTQLRQWIYRSIADDTGYDIGDSNAIDALWGQGQFSIYETNSKPKPMRELVGELINYKGNSLTGGIGVYEDVVMLRNINDAIKAIQSFNPQEFAINEEKDAFLREYFKNVDQAIRKTESFNEVWSRLYNDISNGSLTAAKALEQWGAYIDQQKKTVVAVTQPSTPKGITVDLLDQYKSSFSDQEMKSILKGIDINAIAKTFNIFGEERQILAEELKMLASMTAEMTAGKFDSNLYDKQYQKVEQMIISNGKNAIQNEKKFEKFLNYIGDSVIKYTDTDAKELTPDEWQPILKRFGVAKGKRPALISQDIGRAVDSFYDEMIDTVGEVGYLKREITNSHQRFKAVVQTLELAYDEKSTHRKNEYKSLDQSDRQEIGGEIGLFLGKAYDNAAKMAEETLKVEQKITKEKEDQIGLIENTAKKTKEQVKAEKEAAKAAEDLAKAKKDLRDQSIPQDIIPKHIDETIKMLNDADKLESAIFDFKGITNTGDLENEVRRTAQEIFNVPLIAKTTQITDSVASIGLVNKELGIVVQQTWQLQKASEEADASFKLMSLSAKQDAEAAQKYLDAQRAAVDKADKWRNNQLKKLETQERAYKESGKKIDGSTPLLNIDATSMKKDADRTIDDLAAHIRLRLEETTGTAISSGVKNSIERDISLLENEIKIQQARTYASTTMSPTEINAARQEFDNMLSSMEAKAKKDNIFDKMSDSFDGLRKRLQDPDALGYVKDSSSVSAFVDDIRIVRSRIDALKAEEQQYNSVISLQNKLYESKKKLAVLNVTNDANSAESEKARRLTEELQKQYDQSVKLINNEEQKRSILEREAQLQKEVVKLSVEQNSKKLADENKALSELELKMDNVTTELGTMEIKLNQVFSVPGSYKAIEAFDNMTEAANRFKSAQTLGEKQNAYDEYTKYQKQFKAEVDNLTATQKTQAEAQRESDNALKGYYKSLMTTLQGIDSLDTKINSLKLKDNGTGTFLPLIENLENQKAELLNKVNEISKQMKSTFQGSFYQGANVELPFSNLLNNIGDEKVSGRLKAFFSDARVQAVLTEQEIEKFIFTLQKSQTTSDEFALKLTEKLGAVNDAFKKMNSFANDGMIDKNSKYYEFALKRYNDLINYRKELEQSGKADPSTWNGVETAAMMNGINLTSEYLNGLNQIAKKEAQYFANKQKYTDGMNFEKLGTLSTEVKGATAGIDNFKNKLSNAAKEFSNGQAIITGFKQSADGISTLDFSVLDRATNTMRKFSMETGTVSNAMYITENAVNKTTSSFDAAYKQLNSVNDLIGKLQSSGINVDNTDNNSINRLIETRNKLNSELAKNDNADQNVLKSLTAQAKLSTSEMEKLYKQTLQMKNAISDGSALNLGKAQLSDTGGAYAQLTKSVQEFANTQRGATVSFGKFNQNANTLEFTLTGTNGIAKTFTATMSQLNGQVIAQQKGVKQAATSWGMFKRDISSIGKQFMTAFVGYNVFYKAISSLRQGVTYVKEIDLALTELKKVTDETEASYKRFLDTATEAAGRIGSTVSDFTEATANFARLGYTMSESAQMAESAIVYKNVADGLDTVEESTESIISTMKAFGIESSGTMGIIDRFNEVGNNFSITSAGIGDALQRSASALYAAGNTIDESIALVTAANSVIQNPEQVGTALKTLSLRIRGVKTELEDAGLETEGMAETTAQLQAKLKALTGGKVDILIDEDTFKNTTQILREMSAVWEEMTDMEQAAALELIGGKRQANILASLISNFDTVEDVIETSMNSSGSAIKENLKWLDSIEGKTYQFTNALESMWNKMISSDFIKFFLDLGTSAVQFLESIGPIPTALLGITSYFSLIKKSSPVNIFKDLSNQMYNVGRVSQQLKSLNMLGIGGANLNTESISSYATVVSALPPKYQALTLASAGLTNAQIKEVMALNQLEDATIKQAMAESGLVTAKGKAIAVTAEEAAVMWANNQVMLSEAAATWLVDKATGSLTVKKIKNAVASGELTAVTGAEIIATYNLAEAQTTLKTAMSGVGKSVKSLIASNPIMFAMMAGMAINSIIDKISDATDQTEKLKEAYDNLQTSISTLKGNINSLESELDNINGQINELENKNGLTVAEAEQLNLLKLQSEELERQKRFQEDLLKTREKQNQTKSMSMINNLIKTTAAGQKEAAESAAQWGKYLGIAAGALVGIGALALAPFTGGGSVAAGVGLAASLGSTSSIISAGILGGTVGSKLGENAGYSAGSNSKAIENNNLIAWYESYEEAIEKASYEAQKAENEYLINTTDENYETWQKKTEALNTLQTEMSNGLQELQVYISDLDYNEQTSKVIDSYNSLMTHLDIKSNGGDVNAQVTSLESLKKEYDELSKGVDENGKNIALSAEEYARYNAIVNQVLSSTPSLIQGYDEEGNAILNRNTLLEDSIELLKEQQRVEAEKLTNPENLKSSYQTAKLNYKDLIDFKLSKDLNGEFLSKLENIVRDKQELGQTDEDFVKENFDEIQKNWENILELAERTEGKDFADSLNADFRDISSNVENAKSAFDEFKQNLHTIPQGSRFYDELSGEHVDFINSYIDSFDDVSDLTNEEIFSIRRNILDLTEGIASNDVAQNLIDRLFQIDDSLPANKYREAIKNVLDQLVAEDIIDDDIKDKIFSQMIPDSENIDKMINTVKSKLSKDDKSFADTLSQDELKLAFRLVADVEKISKEELEEKIKEALPSKASVKIKTHAELTNDFTAFNEVQQQTEEIIMNDTLVTKEYKDSLVELVGSEEAVSECFDANNDLVVSNVAALHDLIAASKDNITSNIKLARSQARLEYYNLYKELQRVTNGTEVADAATLDYVDALYEQMNALEQTISQYSMLEAELLGATNAYTDFEKAQEIDESTDYIGKAEGMVLALGQAFNDATLGSETAQAAIKGLVPESVYKDLDTVDEKMQAIHDYFKDGDISDWFALEYDDEGAIQSAEMTVGTMKNFIEDGLSRGVFTGKDWKHFELSEDINSLEEFAEQMKTTEAVAFAFFETLEDHDTEWLNGDYSTLFDELVVDGSKLDSIKEQIESEFDQSPIDLTARVKVSKEKMQNAGYEEFDGDYATFYTQTFTASDFGLTNEKGKDYAINLTPILPDGTVIEGGEEGLVDWVNKQLDQGKKIEELDVFIGSYDSGKGIEESLKQAEESAERLHELSEDYTEAYSSFNLENDIQKNISELADLKYQLATDEISAEEYAKKIDKLSEAQANNAQRARENATAWSDASQDVVNAKEKVETLTDELNEMRRNGASETEIKVKTKELQDASEKLSEALQKKYNLEEPTELTLKLALDDIDAQIDKWEEDPIIKEVKPKIEQDGETGKYTIPADVVAKFDETERAAIQNYLSLLNDQYVVQVLADENPEDSTAELDKVKTAAELAKQAIDNIPSPKVDTSAAQTSIQNLIDKIKEIPKTKTSYISTVYSTIGKPPKEAEVNGTANFSGSAHATGTAHKSGDWGLPKAEHDSLVGELGPEIVVDPHSGRYYTVGDRGAEMVDLPKDAIIFNHKQTEGLLRNGHITSRGKAYAEGNAHVTIFTTGTSNKEWETSKNRDTSKNKNKNKKKKDTEDTFEEFFDWFEIKIEEINEDLDLMAAKLENTITIKGKNNILNQMIKTNKSELTTLEKGYKLYNNYASSILKQKKKNGNYIIPKKYWDEVKNGKVAIERFYGEVDEKTLEQIKNYREWAQKAADLKQQIQEVRREITELAKQKFDNISEKYDNIEGLQDSRQQHYVDMADYREDKGWINSDKYYKAAMSEEKKKMQSNKNEKKRLQASLDNSVKKGHIKKYSAEWYEMVNAIHAVDAAIDENKANIEDYQNKINEVHFENFEKGLYRVSRIAEETQNLIDLMADKDVVNVNDETGKVEWTKEGITQMGLYAQTMENAKKQNELYAKEIDNLNKMYDDGKLSKQEYLEKLDELKDGQYDSIKLYQDSKDAIVEMQKARVDEIKNGIDKQIDAYSELIDKKKEELDAEKDLYDFQKSVIDQKKSISDIDRQLAALAGDNSASARAQRKKLEAERAKAQQDLNDSYYDRSVEKQKEALDTEFEQFEELREKEKEGWDKWLENVDAVFDDAIDTVQSSGTTIQETIKGVAKEWDLQINDNIKKPWSDASTALSDTSTRLDEVIQKFQTLTENVDKIAEKNINSQKDQNADITDEKKDKFQNGEKAYVKKGTQAYNSKGNKSFKVGDNTGYTVVSTDNKTGMTKVKNSKGEIRYFKTSDLSEKAFSNGSSGSNATYYKKYTGKSSSIVDALKAIGVSNTLATRKKIAKANGISNYSGTAKQNTKLLDLLKKGKLKKYAKGSLGINKDQLAWLDELGEELQIVPNGNGRLDYVKKGTGIIPADMTERLMNLAMNPQDMLDRNRPTVGVSPEVHNTEINLNIQYGDMLKIENFKGDNPDEIAKIVAKQFEKHTKDLNSALRKYVR